MILNNFDKTVTCPICDDGILESENFQHIVEDFDGEGMRKRKVHSACLLLFQDEQSLTLSTEIY